MLFNYLTFTVKNVQKLPAVQWKLKHYETETE